MAVIRFPVGIGIFFSSPARPHRLCGPASLLSNGELGAISPGVKRPWREADHSPSSSAEVKYAWSCTSNPPVRLHWVNGDMFSGSYLFILGERISLIHLIWGRIRPHTWFWRDSQEKHSCLCPELNPGLPAGVLITTVLCVKVKLSLCSTKYHAMKTYRGRGGIAPRILSLGARWRWVFSFTPRPLYSWGKDYRYELDRRLGWP
jgi:hypothetical protein